MNQKVIMTVLSAIMVSICLQPVMAQESVDLTAPTAKEEIQQKGQSLAASFTPEETARLAILRNSFGMIRSVELVRQNIDDAVKACGKKNPDMILNVAYFLYHTHGAPLHPQLPGPVGA